MVGEFWDFDLNFSVLGCVLMGVPSLVLFSRDRERLRSADLRLEWLRSSLSLLMIVLLNSFVHRELIKYRNNKPNNHIRTTPLLEPILNNSRIIRLGLKKPFFVEKGL